MYSSSALSENAEIFYDVIGEGPYLIMVSGAGGNSARYEDVATQLSNHFTVVRYDRRCNSRSGGNSELGAGHGSAGSRRRGHLRRFRSQNGFSFW